jgi:hypothetical protein
VAKIAVNLDNTLVSHIPLYKKIWGEKGKSIDDPEFLPKTWGFDNWELGLKKAIYSEFSRTPPGFMTMLPPLEGAIEALSALKWKGYHIEIVTSRIKHINNLKYILDLFPMVDWVEIVGLTGKLQYINNNAFDYWIDDYPETWDCPALRLLISNENTPYNFGLRENYTHFRSIIDLERSIL